ncbi:DUF4446 family protein [Clostridium ganghwense]|uniref:DUF4446 family protein n=1 Tax=Clostridium ganghwense TaxID=312089 RepID=A0ABT4CT66_9CLOT|nr:DUF4446 family protein [Clostridium ganghwense]MCY6372260.1 DUF4446 family protein [Clostridium ganghwense]
MKELLQTLSDLQPYITIALMCTIIILLIVTIVIFKSLNKLEIRYRKLTRGINNKNLEEIVTKYLDNIDEVKADTEIIKNQQEELDKKFKKSIQKVAILRYKAFEDVGSDLSFSVALLNDNNDGVVITGIYGRSDSTVYAKPIDKGISRYDLSEEEEEVLIEASNK